MGTIVVKQEVNHILQMLLFYSLNSMGLLSLLMGVKVYRMKREGRINRYWMILCIASFLCSSAYGWLSVAETALQAFIIRDIGLLGLYYWIGYSILLIIEMTTGKEKPGMVGAMAWLVTLFAIPLTIINGRPGSVVFQTSPFGTSFCRIISEATILYTYTATGLLCILAVCVMIHWYRKAEMKRDRMHILKMAIALGMIPLGFIPNLVLPALGYAFFPGTAFGGFITTCILYNSCRRIDSESISIEKIAGKIVSSITTPILLLNMRGEILNMNESAELFIGRKAEELLYTNCDMYFTMSDKEENPSSRLKEVINENKKELSIASAKLGEKISCQLHYDILYDQYNEVLCIILMLYDITKMEENRVKLEEVASKDFLTGLYNRRFAENMISSMLKEHKGTLILFDIDNFKEVNDTYGHALGDNVIKATARLLMKYAMRDSISYRYGGDELGLYLPGTYHQEYIEELIQKIMKGFQKEVVKLESGIHCSVSAGIAIQNNREEDYDELFRRADEALYQAKLSGKNRHYTHYV